MKQLSTRAILLKRLNFGEADRIITVITPDHGKLSLLAKGVRRSNSKLAGGLELFSVSEITFIDGKSDLKTVISTRLASHFGDIVGDGNCTMTAYDIMKFTDAFSEHSHESIYFDLLEASLQALNQGEIGSATIYVWYCTQVLREVGSAINLEKPLNKKQFSEDASYQFSLEDMSFFERSGGNFIPNHVKLLRLMVRADTPNKLSNITGYSELASDLQPLFTQIMTVNRA